MFSIRQLFKQVVRTKSRREHKSTVVLDITVLFLFNYNRTIFYYNNPRILLPSLIRKMAGTACQPRQGNL